MKDGVYVIINLNDKQSKGTEVSLYIDRNTIVNFDSLGKVFDKTKVNLSQATYLEYNLMTLCVGFNILLSKIMVAGKTLLDYTNQ